jgi:hypothetical protein
VNPVPGRAAGNIAAVRGGSRTRWAVLAVAILAAGCSSGGSKAAGPTTTTGRTVVPTGPTGPATTAGSTLSTTTTTSSLDRTVMASAGGLTITLAVTPIKSKGSKPIAFNLSAQEGEAHGALEYQLFYGDGKTDQNPAPQYCVTAASVAHSTWTLTHHYAAPGTYMVVLTAWANCTRDRARTQAVAVTIT